MQAFFLGFPCIFLQPTRALVDSETREPPIPAGEGARPRSEPRASSGPGRARRGSTRHPGLPAPQNTSKFCSQQNPPARAGSHPSGGDDARHGAQCSDDAFLDKLDAALAAGDIDAAVRHVRRGELLARSRRLHLEHQDDGRARSGPRHARPLPQAGEAARLAHRRGRGRDRGGRRARILDFVRDRDRAGLWPSSASRTA